MAGEPDTASARLGLQAATHRRRQLPAAARSQARADLCRTRSEVETAHGAHPPAPRDEVAQPHRGQSRLGPPGLLCHCRVPTLGCADGWMWLQSIAARQWAGGFAVPVGVLPLPGGSSPGTAAGSLPSWRERGASTQDRDIWVLFLALLLAIHHISPFSHLLSGNNAVLLKLST